MKFIIASLAGIFIIGSISCTAPKPFYAKGEQDWKNTQHPQSPVEHTVFLLGGIDYEKSKTTESFELLKQHLNPDDTTQTVVFMNDRIYKRCCEEDKDFDKSLTEKQLDIQFDYLKKNKSRVYFIAGHERTRNCQSFSPKLVKDYVEKKLNKKDVFYPKENCPGPDIIEINNKLVLIPINTSYWLWEQEEEDSDCDVKNEKKWVEEIKEVIDANQRKNILVLGHHPLVSLGNHGGWFSLKQHIFPLTELNKNLYLPLPVIGTLYPLLRIASGFRNDRAYPPYNRMRRSLLKTFYKYKDLTYVSGLEQNFQYFDVRGQNYIITNSANESTFTASIKSSFTYSENGLVKMSYFENGEVWMETIIPDSSDGKGKVVFRKKIKDTIYESSDDRTAIKPSDNVTDSTITIVANKNLKAGPLKQLFLGQHYRDAWSAPVSVPVIDLQNEEGGLEIIKKGGGNQTKSLHLKNKKGEEVTLRSVVKFPENLLGPMMTKTLAADVVRDQTSSIHPYTPFVIDNLSEIAGILHSDPKIVFIPNDVYLAEYRADFANTLAVYEKKADGNIAPADNFNNVEEAISSTQLMKAYKKDNSVIIDDYALLKSRLFDMWINDWDRHQDQWRWGLVTCKDAQDERCRLLNTAKHYYVPIPKDRDQAFARFDGVIPWLAGRRWAARRFQHFTDEVKDVTGLNFNARNFDHAFLSDLSREDWTRISGELQSELTDQKIENAIKQFPDTIYQLDGVEMINTLKARRNNMPSFTKRYYEFLSKQVDVLGSDEKEIFEIVRINNESTSVKMYDGIVSENSLIYSRTFIKGETREVRIYGRGGDDIFNVSGKVKKGIIIRIIGGDENDRISDKSFVKRGLKKTRIYDDAKKNSIDKGNEAKDLTSKDKDINDYNYFSYKYNLVAPATFFGYNVDDGVFVGGGVLVKYQGFRKQPYSFKQRLVANVALKETSFNLKYTGDFIEVFGKWGIHADAFVRAPKSITNFFGLGNETIRTIEDDAFYRLRYNNIYVYLGLKRPIRKYQSIKIGPVYEYIEVEKTPGRFLTSTEGLQYIEQSSSQILGGARLEYEFQHIDDSVLTFRGIRWTVAGISQTALDQTSYTTTNIESQLSLYVPVANRATVALRFGGATRIGDFDFFQANTLGGHSLQRENGNLRGYLRGRYSGRSVGYINTDLRVKLFTFKTYLFPAHFGILGFYDQGRVWTDNETSKKWHTGYGGGIWIDPFAMTIINLNYAVSKEEKLVTLAIGFLF